MYKQHYEAFKYALQDTYCLYLGTKYSMEEILENEDIPFKFRLIVERYMLSNLDMQDTLESSLYYLTQKDLLYRIYKQLKAKVKISIIEDKKPLLGPAKKQYVTQTLPVWEFAEMAVQEKEQKGVVIQELIVNKMAMSAF